MAESSSSALSCIAFWTGEILVSVKRENVNGTHPPRVKCGKGCEIADSSPPPPLHHLILGQTQTCWWKSHFLVPRQGRRVALLGEGGWGILLHNVSKDHRYPHPHVCFLWHCKRFCLSLIINKSFQYIHRLLHLPCLLHVQQGRDPQVHLRLSVSPWLWLFSLIQRTAADNLAEDSPAAWFLVFASALWYLAGHMYLPRPTFF